MKTTLDERTLTELDHARLERLLRENDAGSNPTPLDEALDLARCVPSRRIEPNVVTMGSRLLLLPEDGSGSREVTLCYPPEARPGDGLVSVLSPLGAALIGLRIGDVARWRTPDGHEKRARVVTLLFQPEANGFYTL